MHYHDGRQSELALDIQRGAMRSLAHKGFSCVSEITLPNGRRADLMGMHQNGDIIIVEIKSSKQDFTVDQKWPEYREYCDLFAFATHLSVDQDIFPSDEGLLVCDSYGGDFIRNPVLQKLAGARRKAVTQQLFLQAAKRFHRLMDPQFSL